MADAEERDLIQRAQGGDRAAFGRLVRMHQRRLFACAYRMMGDGSQAEDAVQDAFVRAYRAIDRFDGRSELSTWLYRICVNVCLNALRKRGRHQASDLAEVKQVAVEAHVDGADPGATVEGKQLRERLQKALDSLSPSLRTTLILVQIEGMPQKEAAVVLGCSEGTVAWRVHEARRRLRKSLGPLAAAAAAPSMRRSG